MDKILILDLAAEGGGANIYGSEGEDGWIYWTENNSYDSDEDCWVSSQTEPVDDLESVIPKDWLWAYPLKIHAPFLGWFQDYYQTCLSNMDEFSWKAHDSARWENFLYNKTEGMDSREARYNDLVSKRKICRICYKTGLENPAVIDGGKYDCERLREIVGILAIRKRSTLMQISSEPNGLSGCCTS